MTAHTGEPIIVPTVTVSGRKITVTPCPKHAHYFAAGFLVPGCAKCQHEMVGNP